jgi:hypothetical protein
LDYSLIKILCYAQLKHVSILQWQMTLNLNEPILKLRKSTRPAG